VGLLLAGEMGAAMTKIHAKPPRPKPPKPETKLDSKPDANPEPLKEEH